MEAMQIISVTPAEFFNYLVQQHIDAAAQFAKKKISRGDILNGISYEMFFGDGPKKEPVKIKVGPVLEDRYFEVNYTMRGKNRRYFYDLSHQPDGRCRVVYHEENTLKGHDKKTFLNNIQDKYDLLQAQIAAQRAISKMEKEIRRKRKRNI